MLKQDKWKNLKFLLHQGDSHVLNFKFLLNTVFL